MRETLTPRRLAAILKSRPPGRKVITDAHPDAPPGFRLRLSPTSASWYLVASKRWHKIGDAKSLGVEEARRVARVFAGRIAEGRSPTEERRADRERRRAEAEARRKARATVEGMTLAGLVRRSVEAKASRLAARTMRETTRALSNDLAPSDFGQRPAASIRRDELRAWLHEFGRERPHSADRLLQLIRYAYRWALDEQTGGADFGITLDPSRGIKPLVSGAALVRDRVLIANVADDRAAYAELVAWLRGLETLDVATRCFARFILFTASRFEETRVAAWSEMDDLDGSSPVWRIPKAHRKGGRTDHVVPLSTSAVGVLKELREAFPGEALVFARVMKPAPGRRIRRATGLDVKVHDVRRTTASLAVRLGAPVEMAQRILGHKVAHGVLAHYVQLQPLEDHRRWLQAVSDKVAVLLGAEPSKVIAGRFGAPASA